MIRKIHHLVKRRLSANDRFERFRHEHSLLFAAFVLCIAVLVIVNTLFMIHLLPKANNTTSVYPSWTTSLQLAYNGAVQTQIRNVATQTSDPVFPIDENQVALVMDVTVKNITRETQQFIPVNQLYVRGEEGTYASIKVSSLIKKAIPATDLVAGESVSGQVCFIIPKTVAQPLLYVDTGWDRSTPLVIDVLH